MKHPRQPYLGLEVIAIVILMVSSLGYAFTVSSSATATRPLLHLSASSDSDANVEPSMPISKRRKIIQHASAAIATIILPSASSTNAFAADTDSVEPYTRVPSPNDKFNFSYTVTPPPDFAPGNKPLKTHLDEINFSPPDVRGYTLGITVDPVRISKIQEFGTPEEVAARVVTAEVNRDGVFKVTLAKDPTEDTSGDTTCYDIEYISDGKRGTKRFATRIYITGGFLYVLTLQSKESEYDSKREAEVLKCVKSFKPLSV